MRGNDVSWYNRNLGPQMVHNPNGPVMVHFYVLSTNYTKKPAHSILKRRNKVNLIQMDHKWSTFTFIPLIILKNKSTAYYDTEIKWTLSNVPQMVHNPNGPVMVHFYKTLQFLIFVSKTILIFAIEVNKKLYRVKNC